MTKFWVFVSVLMALGILDTCTADLLRSVQKALQNDFDSTGPCVQTSVTGTEQDWFGGSFDDENDCDNKFQCDIRAYARANFKTAFPDLKIKMGGADWFYATFQDFITARYIYAAGEKPFLMKTVALLLNVGFDVCSLNGNCPKICPQCTRRYTLGIRFLLAGECKGKTVTEVVTAAKCLLAGGNKDSCGYAEPSDISSCIDLINENYANNRDLGNIGCAAPPTPDTTVYSTTCPPSNLIGGRTQTVEDWVSGGGQGKSCTTDSQCYALNNFKVAFESGLDFEMSMAVGKAMSILVADYDFVRSLYQGKGGFWSYLLKVLAVQLNVAFDKCSRKGDCEKFCDTCTMEYMPLADKTVLSGICSGLSVSTVLEKGNCVLAAAYVNEKATCGYTQSEISSCLDLISNNYKDGLSDKGHLGGCTTAVVPDIKENRKCDLNQLSPAPLPAHTKYYFTQIGTPTITINNLGGYCGKGASPDNGLCGEKVEQIIRIENAGLFGTTPVTVDISSLVNYVPSRKSQQNAPNANGAGYNGLEGMNLQINLQLGEKMLLFFLLRDGNTGLPLSVPKDAQGNEQGVIQFEITFYDLDMGVKKNQPGCTQCNRATGLDNPSGGCKTCACKGARDVLDVMMLPSLNLQYSYFDGVPTTLCREELHGNMMYFWGDQGSLNGGSNNPLFPHSDKLTDFQKQVAVNLMFTGTNNVTVGYEIFEPTGRMHTARNIVANLFAQRRDCALLP